MYSLEHLDGKQIRPLLHHLQNENIGDTKNLLLDAYIFLAKRTSSWAICRIAYYLQPNEEFLSGHYSWDS